MCQHLVEKEKCEITRVAEKNDHCSQSMAPKGERVEKRKRRELLLSGATIEGYFEAERRTAPPETEKIKECNSLSKEGK